MNQDHNRLQEAETDSITHPPTNLVDSLDFPERQELDPKDASPEHTTDLLDIERSIKSLQNTPHIEHQVPPPKGAIVYTLSHSQAIVNILPCRIGDSIDIVTVKVSSRI